MASDDPEVHDTAMRRYSSLQEQFESAGGYAAEAEAASIESNLGVENRILQQPLKTLSGGQRRCVELATILFSGADTLLLDEPTNNLDPASREDILRALATFSGAVVLVSHDVGAVTALNPERVLILPDDDEDHWNKGYEELILLS